MTLWIWLKDPKSEPIIQYVLFALLVVATPFVVVSRYLQNLVYIVSHFSFSLFGQEVPFVLSLAVLLCLYLVTRYFRSITPKRILALLFIGAMIAFSQQTMDLYMDVSFFDLQQNWHYLAYGTYVFFFFRAFNVRRMPMNKMILCAYASALGMSTFDETFQLLFSQRVFDISDITKDAWGTVMALILVVFVTETYGTTDLKKISFPKKRFADYLKYPETALLAVFTLTFIFVCTSPLLSEHAEAGTLLLISFALFAVIWLVFHLSRYRAFRLIVYSILLLAVVVLVGSFLLHRGQNITYNSFGMTVYQGIPLPFFDVLIYPDGSFRFVDKKHHFRSTDIQYFRKQKPAILLVGSGSRGRGGKGFEQGEGVHFIYNEYTGRGTQVIILPTPQACRKFNELKAAGKNVLFVLHNTC